MYYREELLLEQYDLEILDTYKGRGAVFAMTNAGKIYLKEYPASEVKADFLKELLKGVNEQGIHTETVIETEEGESLTKNPEGYSYMLRSWCEGRECNTSSRDEILASVDILAQLHNAMNRLQTELPEVLHTDEGKLLKAYEKHTRELRTVKNYVKNKKRKNEFEQEFLLNYPRFEKQATEILEELRMQSANREGFGLCHGDFNQHNVVFLNQRPGINSFDNLCYDLQVGDLARFMRKILEKNNWNMGLGMEMISTYNKKKPLSEYENRQIYLRLAYPEKFWKVANHYYNANKAWGFGRYLEKLEKIKAEETNREQFLECMKHFTYT